MSEYHIPESMLARALDAFYGTERDKRCSALTSKKRRELMEKVLLEAIGDEFSISPRVAT